MPTGYTSGIIDGDIKTFKEFATLCMRAFGATMHMRDESFDTKYVSRTPSDYHKRQYKDYEKKLIQAKQTLPSEYATEYKDRTEKSIKEYQDDIVKTKKQKDKLEKMLKEVNKFVPPTPEHVGIAEFMVSQLEETIRFDGNFDYYEEKIKSLKEELKYINGQKLLQEHINSIIKDIDYHKVEYKKEVTRVKEANKWVIDFLDSIK